MLKTIKVSGYSDRMNAEMRCVTLEEGFEVYNQFLSSPYYHSGDISDLNTGELYAYFEKSIEGNGIQVNTWTAVE